jgi:hypothetical protein
VTETRKRTPTAAVQSVSSLLQEFKKFALKGNVIDLAVALDRKQARSSASRLFSG